MAGARVTSHRATGPATAAATAAGLPRFAVGQPAGARTLRMVPQANLTSIDPIWTTANITRNHGFMVYDTLFGMDAGFRARPQMAEGARTEEDGRAVTTPRDRTVIRLPAYEQVKSDPVLYAHANRVLHLETNPGNARALVQRHGERERTDQRLPDRGNAGRCLRIAGLMGQKPTYDTKPKNRRTSQNHCA